MSRLFSQNSAGIGVNGAVGGNPFCAGFHSVCVLTLSVRVRRFVPCLLSFERISYVNAVLRTSATAVTVPYVKSEAMSVESAKSRIEAWLEAMCRKSTKSTVEVRLGAMGIDARASDR